MQLMMDLQRPSSRAGTPPLPNQAPRQPPSHLIIQRDPTKVALPRSPLTAYPPVTAQTPPPPVATPIVAGGKQHNAAHLKRGLSVRSLDSTASEYSVASAPRDVQERTYQPFNLTLATVPASPTTPKWPSSPGTYVWPKRQRASLIREELAPETYAKVRWKTDDGSIEPTLTPPVAHALVPAVRSVSSPTSPGPALRINVPPPVHHHRSTSDSPDSASTAAMFYVNASAASSSPTIPSAAPAPRPAPF